MALSFSVSQVLIGQLTDTHVLAANGDLVDAEVYVDNNDRLRQAVRSIVAEPDPLAAVVVTGDLTNDGRPEEYDAFDELIDPIATRVLPIPGNHDRPKEVRARFPNAPWADADHCSWVTTVGTVRIVGLDSTRMLGEQPEHGGMIDEARATWLDSVLSTSHDGVTVLAMHHPPFASGIWWMDRYGFEGVSLLAEVLVDRPIDRIMCGHLHRPMSSVFAGAVAQVGMSTVQHVGPDFGLGDDVTVVTDPVGYQILQVRSHDVHSGPDSGPRAVLHHRYIDPVPDQITPIWADEFR